MWGKGTRMMDELELDKRRVEDVYELGNELGKGGFSIVRQGKHRTTGEPAAIKIISAGRFKGNARAQAAILAEIEAMRRVRDKSRTQGLIVTILGVFGDPTKVCIALEKLDGGELFDRIVERGHYTEKDASQVLRKLALALNDCHSNGILHRDVKPENILYVSTADDAEIKLTDFGLAMLDTGASITRRDDNLVGTPGYVAPEVLSLREYGPPCDVWACGVITYILLVGYPPFFPTGDDTLFDVIKKGQYFFHPDAWDSVSSEAKDLVYKMLMVDTDKRATMESIINHPWVTQQHGLSETHLSGTITRLKAFSAKRKWRAVASVVMLGAKFGLKKRARGEAKESKDTKQHGFSQLELQTLKQAFDSSAEGGVLSRSQLADVLSEIGFGPVPSDRLFDLFDADGNGEVDYQEFLVGISSFRSSGENALRFCFDVYDRDGVGAIKLEQLKAVLLCVMGTQDDSGWNTSQKNISRTMESRASSSSSLSPSASVARKSPATPGDTPGTSEMTCSTSEVASSMLEPVPSSSTEGPPSLRLQGSSADRMSIWEGKLSDMFSLLDVDGNGAIDFDEFKSGVKREPLLVQAFLGPVQQGSLGNAPVTKKRSSAKTSLDKKSAGTGNGNVCQGVTSPSGGCANGSENMRIANEKDTPAEVSTQSSQLGRCQRPSCDT